MKSKDVNQLEIFGENKKRYLYAIVISLIPPASEEIQRRRINVHKFLFPTINAPFSPGHVSLLDIEHDDDEVIVNKVGAAIASQKGFDVELKGINIFVHGNKRSIIIPVANPDSIQQLFNDLKTALNIRLKLKLNPHVTIIKSISLKKFRLIEPVLFDYSYAGKFFCTGVTVIKQPADDESAPWQEIDDISFPVLTV